MPIATFLAEYWQKKPVLIRRACIDNLPNIVPEVLAGLSLEDEVESRLIENADDIMDWQVLHGPLQDQDFAKNRSFPWTLLVQGVDRYLPEAYEFLAGFRFLPAWRLDDLMLSYATKGAGVGAHYDRYDVFLIQGEGRRRWELGQQCNISSATLPHEQLHLLEQFDSHTNYELEKGDLLYIPPLMAHKGVALTDHCITLSVGFRAPAIGEIWQDFANYHSDQLNIDERLQNQVAQSNHNTPAKIDLTDIQHIQSLMQSQLTTNNIANWFGYYSTLPKAPELIEDSIDEPMDQGELLSILVDGYGVCRVAENAQCLYFTNQVDDNQTNTHQKEQVETLNLFVNGESILCDATAAELGILLADQLVVTTTCLADYLMLPSIKPTAIALFLRLYNQGVIYFDDE